MVWSQILKPGEGFGMVCKVPEWIEFGRVGVHDPFVEDQLVAFDLVNSFQLVVFVPRDEMWVEHGYLPQSIERVP